VFFVLCLGAVVWVFRLGIGSRAERSAHHASIVQRNAISTNTLVTYK